MKWTLAVVAVSALTGSARRRRRPITDEHVQELIRLAAERAGVTAQTARSRHRRRRRTGADARPIVALTVDDAIKLALDRNLDIAVQRLNPQTFDYSIASHAGVLQADADLDRQPQLANQPVEPDDLGRAAPARASRRRPTPSTAGSRRTCGGAAGRLSATLNNNKQTTTSLTALFNPQFNTNWSAQYTQPLLRNFKIDTTRQQLVVTKLNQDISEIQLQALIINTVSNVRNAYWDYVFATQSVEVAKRSVELAEQLVKDNQTRVEIGHDGAHRHRAGAVAGCHTAAEPGDRRGHAPHRRAHAEATDRRRHPGSRTGTPRLIPSTGRTSCPRRSTSRPRSVARWRIEPIFSRRRKNLQVNDVTLKYLNNQTLPQADVVARYGLIGQGGTQFIMHRHGHHSRASRTIPGGYADALSTLFNGNYPTWNVSLNVSYPLGTSAADANVARAHIQQNQVEAQLKQIELQIATDVTNAATHVQSNVERVQAAQVAREFAQRTLEAEQSKFEVGHADQLLRRAGAARSGDGAEQRAAGDPGLPAIARRARASAADVAVDLEHHDSGPVIFIRVA